MMTPGNVSRPIWGPGLGRGALWGLLLAALDGATALVLSLLVPRFDDLGPYVLLSLVLLIVEALVIGWSTGRVTISVITTATTAAISTLVETVFTLGYAIVSLMLVMSRPSPFGRDSELTVPIGIILLLGTLWVGVYALVFRLFVGLGIGSLVAWIGSRYFYHAPDAGGAPPFQFDGAPLWPTTPPAHGEVE